MDLPIVSLAIIGNILLGLFVLLRNNKSATNILFFFLTIDIAAWSFANYAATHVLEYSTVLFWVRMTMFLAVPQAVLLFILIHTMPKTKIQLKKTILYPLIILSVVTMGVSLTSLLFPSIKLEGNSPVPTPGPGMLLFLPVAVGSVLAGLITLIKKYYDAQGLEKVQLKYIFVGLFTMFFLIITFNFILLVFLKISAFVILGPLYTLPFVGAVAYAIIKHRLLDIRLVVARSVTYSLLIFLIVGFITLFLSVLGNVFTGEQLTSTTIMMSVFLALIVAFSFHTVEGIVEKLTEKFFFKRQYDPNTFLRNLGHITSSTLSLSLLAEMVLKELLSQMKVSFAFLILTRKGSIRFTNISVPLQR